MKIYIMTQEPYHDNGYITDVFDNLTDAVRKLKDYAANSVTPNSNYDDYRLTEWNLSTNAEERVWELLHQGEYEGPHTWELANPHNKWERVDWPTE